MSLIENKIIVDMKEDTKINESKYFFLSKYNRKIVINKNKIETYL